MTLKEKVSERSSAEKKVVRDNSYSRTLIIVSNSRESDSAIQFDLQLPSKDQIKVISLSITFTKKE